MFKVAPKNNVYHDPVGKSVQQFIGQVGNLKFAKKSKKNNIYKLHQIIINGLWWFKHNSETFRIVNIGLIKTNIIKYFYVTWIAWPHLFLSQYIYTQKSVFYVLKNNREIGRLKKNWLRVQKIALGCKVFY